MSKVRIVVDSTSDIRVDLREKYGIYTIPLNIVMNDESFADMIDTTPVEIIKWSNDNKTTPKTAAPSIVYAEEILQKCKDADEDVVFFGISEDMSTTCNVIRLVSEDLDYADRVKVIDSLNLSIGIAIQAVRAAELAEAGKSADEIYDIICADRHKVQTSFIVDELTFLARGGRCSAATALFAGALKIKPRIELHDGKMGVGKKYRGNYQKTLDKYIDDLKEVLPTADDSKVFIAHSPVKDEYLQQFVDSVKALNYFKEIVLYPVGGVITSHCGPGTIGISYYEK